MKCGIEFKEIKDTAQKSWEIEQARLDAIAMKEYESLTAKSIDFCETIVDNDLTKKALDRKLLEVSYKIKVTKNRVNQSICNFIVESSLHYSDGSPSYTPSKEKYALDTIRQYLKDHCIESDIYQSSYKEYGMGYCSCLELKIFIPKGIDKICNL